MYGSAQQIPDRSLVQEIAAIYLDSLYNTECDKRPPVPALCKPRDESHSNGGRPDGPWPYFPPTQTPFLYRLYSQVGMNINLCNNI